MGESSEKLTRRELKNATDEIDRLMEEHCSMKRTPRLVRFFMRPEEYALHVQHKFNRLEERDQQRMRTVGEKIKKGTKKKRAVLDRVKVNKGE